MGRFIVLLGIVLAAIWLLRRALARAEGDSAPAERAGAELVSCARCGLHLPRPEARAAEGRLYCSEEHARLGPARP
ncbi:MAG TPA: PP0621 family protein [Burkholderiales bacterium]|nr:PP0621 family protein [Burkholderiales bacterium]